MNERSLHWWSAARLGEAEAVVSDAWRRWCADWDVPCAQVTAVNAFEPGDEDAEPAWAPLRDADAPGVWIAFGHDAIDSMRSLLFRRDADSTATAQPAGPIETEIARAAWKDVERVLADRIGRLHGVGSGGEQVSPDAVPPAGDRRAWSGAVRIRMQASGIPRTSIELHLSGITAAAFMASCAGPVALASPRSVAPLAAAVAAHPVRLCVELDELVLDLGTLRELARGDVISLPHRLDEPLRVRLPGSDARRPICHAALGARDGHRAIELIGAERGA